MIHTSHHPILKIGLCLTLAIAVIVFVVSCDSVTDPNEGHGVEQIVISPQSADIPVGEQKQFSAHALDADGDTIDTEGLEIEWEWWSTDTEIFTVNEEGLVEALSAGEADCIVEATILVDESNFTGRDTARVRPF